MTRPAVRFPDVELLLTWWLRAQLPGVRVVAELPANVESHIPLLWVTRIGGRALVTGLVDQPRVDVDAFARSYQAAAELAVTVQSLIPTMRGVTTGGGVVAYAAEEIGPNRRPEYNPHVRRFGATYVLTIRPA
jgi:hypothetical protein